MNRIANTAVYILALFAAACNLGCAVALTKTVQPRAVFCTNGGLFTGISLNHSATPLPAGSSVALSVCCTTSVFVEGLGTFGNKCVMLGNLKASAAQDSLWGSGDICNSTSVVSDAVIENSGEGAAAFVKSLFVYCVDRTSESDMVVDHLSMTFSASGIDKLAVHRRNLFPAPPTSELKGIVGLPNTSPYPPLIRPVEEFQSCIADGSAAAQSGDQIFYAVDIQCQGVRHDRCTCKDGSVKCVAGTDTGALFVDDMVTESDLQSIKEGGALGWCGEGDPVEDWFLLADIKTNNCKALPAGEKAIINVPCDGSVLSQRWHHVNGRSGTPKGTSWPDSRLESAENPGTCMKLQASTYTKDLVPVIGSCFAANLTSPATNAPTEGGVVVGTQGTLYANSLVVLPLTSAFGTWYDDYKAVSRAMAALGTPFPKAYDNIDAAKDLASSVVYAGRMRASMPHCTQAGVLCNAMGRVIYFAPPKANSTSHNLTSSSNSSLSSPDWYIEGVHSAVEAPFRLPWLISLDLSLSSIDERLPNIAELTTDLSLLRSISFASTKLSGSLSSGLEKLPQLSRVSVAHTQVSGPIPAALLKPSTSPLPKISVDLTGVQLQATEKSPPVPLCVPFAMTAESRGRFMRDGQPADIPLCQDYVSWTVSVAGSAASGVCGACAAASPSHTASAQARGLPLSFHLRSQASNTTGGAYELSCNDACFQLAASEAASPSDINIQSEVKHRHLPVVKSPDKVASVSVNLTLGSAAEGPQVSLARRLLRSPDDILQSLKARPLQPSRSLLQAATSTSNAPTVTFVTLGHEASEEQGKHVFRSMFSDVLRDSDMKHVTVAWEAFNAVTPGSGGPGLGVSGTGDDIGAVIQVPQEKSGSTRVWLVIVLIVFAIIVILLVAVAVIAVRKYTGKPIRFHRHSDKFHSATLPIVRTAMAETSELSYSSESGDVTREMNGYCNRHAPLSMSATALADTREVTDDISQGTGSRRPLWMQVDTSGSFLIKNRGRNTDSSPLVPGSPARPANKSKYASEGGGSPVKALLGCQHKSDSPVTSPIYCCQKKKQDAWDAGDEKEDPGKSDSLISASVDAKDEALQRDMTPPSSYASTHCPPRCLSGDKKPARLSTVAPPVKAASPEPSPCQAQPRSGSRAELHAAPSLPKASGGSNRNAQPSVHASLMCSGGLGARASGVSASQPNLTIPKQPDLDCPSSDDEDGPGTATKPPEPPTVQGLQLQIPANPVDLMTRCSTEVTTEQARRGPRPIWKGPGLPTPDCKYIGSHTARLPHRSPCSDSDESSFAEPSPVPSPAQPAPTRATTAQKSAHSAPQPAVQSETAPEDEWVAIAPSPLPRTQPPPPTESSAPITRPPTTTTASQRALTQTAAPTTAVTQSGTSHTGPSHTPPAATEPSQTAASRHAASQSAKDSTALTPPPTQPTRESTQMPTSKVNGWLEEVTPHVQEEPTHSPIAPSLIGSQDGRDGDCYLSERKVALGGPYASLEAPSSLARLQTTSSTPLTPKILGNEIRVATAALPTGVSVQPRSQGPVFLDSAVGQPCMMLKIQSNKQGVPTTIGRLIVCTYYEQRAALESRARVENICPPLMPLHVPHHLHDQMMQHSNQTLSGNSTMLAPAVCFSCGSTLTEEIEKGSLFSTPDAAPTTLACLCALLQRLHVAGYVSGGLSPDSVVRPLPQQPEADWRLICAHTMLQQGSTAEPVLPLDIRWCAPEQGIYADNPGFDPANHHVSNIAPVADVASDMFTLGLMMFKVVTGRDYWGSMTPQDIAQVCILLRTEEPAGWPSDFIPCNDELAIQVHAGYASMPLVAQDDVCPASQTVLRLIAPLLSLSPPSRPLISELLTSVEQAFPGIAGGNSTRSVPMPPRQRLRASMAAPNPHAPAPAPAMPATTQAVTMRFMFAERGPNSHITNCIFSERIDHKWVFPLAQGRRFYMVVCIELNEMTSLAVFPIESVSHMVVESSQVSPSGTVSQTLEIQSAHAYYAGRGVLLLIPWDPSEVLANIRVREIKFHLFAKVVGFNDLIKISKRIHVRVVPHSLSATPTESRMQLPMDVVQRTREGGIHFEAQIPVAKS